LTQFLTLNHKNEKSAKEPAGTATYGEGAEASGLAASLSATVERHAAFEVASFHTPGHKGRILTSGFQKLSERLLPFDLTELPGLDDLSAPTGVIAQLEARAANLWGSQTTLLSMGGASAGLAAALLALAANDQRRKVLVPRNAHRSIINGLILSGLEPVWFEPVWDPHWGVWGAVSPTYVDKLLARDDANQFAALFIVSPTYAGALSDVKAIAKRCRSASIALVSDEAHGAHFLPAFGVPSPAVQHADITVHSLHKTLCGLTQTGLVHVHPDSRITPAQLRAALNLIGSSSPSYPLMLSIEQTIAFLETAEGAGRLCALKELCQSLSARIEQLGTIQIYRAHGGNDPAHILIRPASGSAEVLQQALQQKRIFAEALLGKGVLLLAGIGSQVEDADALVSVLQRFECPPDNGLAGQIGAQPAPFAGDDQVMTPRQAFLMPSEVVPIEQAVGRIAHECVAPCPPGIPLAIPGQRIHPEVMNIESLRSLRVVKETQ
jgi:arginine/lysine/ornithine decarboxylase